MYDVLKNHLTHGNYTLEDAEERIDYFVATGRIAPVQAAELQGIANSNASSPGGLADELQALRRELEDIKRRFAGDDTVCDDEEAAS
ncbi:MAG: hypothetical protein FWD25_00265 [Clostridia bacterium]|nr:hypothetical protein [Clostridia bacterium]